MAFSDEQRAAVANAINDRCHGRLSKCNLCGRGQWSLVDGLILLNLSEDINSVRIGGPVAPVVALVCSECGNTIFINVLTLGLGHLFGARSEGESIR
jgi:hypothetical protein